MCQSQHRASYTTVSLTLTEAPSGQRALWSDDTRNHNLASLCLVDSAKQLAATTAEFFLESGRLTGKRVHIVFVTTKRPPQRKYTESLEQATTKIRTHLHAWDYSKIITELVYIKRSCIFLRCTPHTKCCRPFYTHIHIIHTYIYYVPWGYSSSNW